MKRIISLILVILSLPIMLTSCDSSKDVITDSDGKEYIVMRDDDGDIVVNANYKLGVYTLNENRKKQKDDKGEFIVEYIEFNGQVVIGRSIETIEMRFKLPFGFKVDDDNIGHFTNDAYDAEIFFTYYASYYNDAVKNAELNCESLLESYGSDVFKYEKYDIDVSGVDCVAFKQRSTSSEFYMNSYVYIIPYGKGYYIVNCTVNTDYEKKIDFDDFITSIELKKGYAL